jgi:hypothetical protein
MANPIAFGARGIRFPRNMAVPWVAGRPTITQCFKCLNATHPKIIQTIVYKKEYTEIASWQFHAFSPVQVQFTHCRAVAQDGFGSTITRR